MQIPNDNDIALGLSDFGLVSLASGHRFDELAAQAFVRLQARALTQGFVLQAASSYRSYASQLAIFNAKWRGDRQVLDDFDRVLNRQDHTSEEWLHRILRFSALPGTSRHHWGTEVDIFDPTLIPEGESLKLIPSEYGSGGYFASLTRWLDGAIKEGVSEDFARPYHTDKGGVAVEPWHLSYRPRAEQLRVYQTPAALSEAWEKWPALRPDGFELILDCLEEIFEQYVV